MQLHTSLQSLFQVVFRIEFQCHTDSGTLGRNVRFVLSQGGANLRELLVLQDELADGNLRRREHGEGFHKDFTGAFALGLEGDDAFYNVVAGAGIHQREEIARLFRHVRIVAGKFGDAADIIFREAGGMHEFQEIVVHAALPLTHVQKGPGGRQVIDNGAYKHHQIHGAEGFEDGAGEDEKAKHEGNDGQAADNGGAVLEKGHDGHRDQQQGQERCLKNEAGRFGRLLGGAKDFLHAQLNLQQNVQHGGRPTDAEAMGVVQEQQDYRNHQGEDVDGQKQVALGMQEETGSGENDGHNGHRLKKNQARTPENRVFTRIKMILKPEMRRTHGKKYCYPS